MKPNRFFIKVKDPERVEPSKFQGYIPEMITVEKDTIYAAIQSISNCLEHTKECLIIHDRDLGRSTRKNSEWAKVLEQDSEQAANTLELLKAL